MESLASGATGGSRIRYRFYGSLIVGWTFGYLAFSLAGQRFSTTTAQSGFQFPPYDLLITDPVVTVTQTHIQPPLWNLTIGLTGRWSPLPDGISFQILMFAVGLAAVLAVGRICRACNLDDRFAVPVALVVGFCPTVFTNVFTLEYELPIAALLLVLIALVVEPAPMSSRRAWAVVGVATVVVLARAVYHPVWLLGVLAFVVVACRHFSFRSLTLLVLVPLLAVGAVTVKNEALVGSPSVTSWSGMNTLRSVQFAFPTAELERLERAGVVSPIATVRPFSEFGAYADVGIGCDPSDRLALSEPFSQQVVVSPFDGSRLQVPNHNYSCLVPVYQQAGVDARALIREAPGVWFEARVASLRAWFTDYPTVDTPAQRWRGAWSSLSLNTAKVDTSAWNERFYAGLVNRPLSVPPILAFVALMTCAASILVRLRRGGPLGPVDRLVLASSFVYGWTMAVGVVFELGEQARFRTGVDQIAYTAVAVVAVTLSRTAPPSFTGRLRAKTSGDEQVSPGQG